jgi:hypothetical protein
MSNTKELGLMKLFSELMLDLDVTSQWMKDYYYYPIAEENKFLAKDSKTEYVIPSIDWSKNLEFDHDELEDYAELWKDGIIDTETRISKYKGLDSKTLQEKLKNEIGGIWDDGQRIRNRKIKPEVEEKKEEPENEKPELNKEEPNIEVPEELNKEEEKPEENKPEENKPEENKPEEVKGE